MMMKTLAAAAVLGLAATSAAQAATLFATGFNDVVVGAGQDPDRTDPNDALGAPDAPPASTFIESGFYELGAGGSIDFTFGTPTGQLFTGPATLVEITFGNNSLFAETTKLFGLLGGVATEIAEFSNDDIGEDGVIDFAFSGIFDELRFADVTEISGEPGQVVSGIDIDSVSVVAAIPLPAAGFLLVGALGALGLARRRSA